ncbi:LysR family transcriptional regulator [Acetobacter sp. TBRC 12305]|uniref:LysR family transcriptional regulator n=2 Tax=Acetobacter garciniae TaxID=2817435 RepID=A0A939HQ06_9PROT|nr:LysR family transcriptional regulator [Acetobacter garciniae]MBO1326676.1 LysR family transcriptional regulator [Acetobacter garciniae]MBX0345029.1 LysR family transcriptional regulator [Acetobacter garciniae]
MDYLAAMRAFVRAAEVRSFSRVAAETGTKVSTISRYITALEADLGAALFNRSTRGLTLTEAGRTFHARVFQILIDLDQARAATSLLNSTPRGLLRINIPRVFGRRHVMPHMKDFLATYPDIRLDATLTDTTVDLIESGADVAIRIGALVDSTLIAKRLAPHRRVLVASPAYLASRPVLESPAGLADHACLRFALQPADAWYYRPQGKPEQPAHEIAVDGRLRANDSETLRDAALAGLGIALLPTWLVAADIHEQRLRSVLAQWEWLLAPGPERAIWAVYPPKKVVAPKVSCFVAFMAERFGKTPYWDHPPFAYAGARQG